LRVLASLVLSEWTGVGEERDEAGCLASLIRERQLWGVKGRDLVARRIVPIESACTVLAWGEKLVSRDAGDVVVRGARSVEGRRRDCRIKNVYCPRPCSACPVRTRRRSHRSAASREAVNGVSL
jgi:hypothetical protein